MEFGEKLQQLRKGMEWTQEQLAEELFVSRTAISKWESGKGYPNIDSLKNISKLFAVSIDDLLSGEELISLAANENRTNINKIFSLVYGTLDVMTISFYFLPLYIRQDSDLIRAVSLFSNPDVSTVTWIIYLVSPILMAMMGIAQIIAQHFLNEKCYSISRTCSILLQAFCILIYVATRQPSATSLLFLFFMIKVVLLIKSS
ncbi:helix-turn-helix transcriptional regulator [Clostridium sp. WB02_MRS01]|uniref:helix-turn-helix domain-containing protein n=1 Tax=Clostridium sp. WB02_MRS01 TaxID=2605777 RepID=UPI0012B26DE2|nr:helix-turn-helix transcriptional regulator [Clostridium sp. WB02_MRS01]MSS08403.1 helix-turn-helix transcriptional regulator [Clostridium sp. WB02_MRS01]